MSAATEQLSSARMVELIGGYAAQLKAVDVVALDLSAASAFTDSFVIATGRSDRQVKAIHDSIQLGMKRDHGILPSHVEGLAQGSWVLIDYIDVVVHIFAPATREYYRLEALWGDVPRRTLSEGEEPDGDDVEA